MTEKLYDSDSYLKEFTATVLDSYPSQEGYITVLDKTAFFPEGGGQPSDTGNLDGVKVFDVRIKDGIIYHYTTEQLTKGQVVKGEINFERRFDFMQQHSAEHIVSGVAHKLYGCENVGFHLSEDIVTLDFDKTLTTEQILKIENEANKAVFENVRFKAWYPDSETLQILTYRSKKELEGAVRIVEIEDTDSCACCAPHVNIAGEIGVIKLLGGEKLRGGIRLELKAGGRALADYNEKYDNIRKISGLLCVKQSETAEAVERLIRQLGEQKAELNNFKRNALEEKIKVFNPEKPITAEFENSMEMKDLQHFADALYKKAGGIRAVLSPAEEGFLFAICGDEKELSEFFKAFKAHFTVKGGGRGTMMQGTVFAEREKIDIFLKEE